MPNYGAGEGTGGYGMGSTFGSSFDNARGALPPMGVADNRPTMAFNDQSPSFTGGSGRNFAPVGGTMETTEQAFMRANGRSYNDIRSGTAPNRVGATDMSPQSVADRAIGASRTMPNPNTGLARERMSVFSSGLQPTLTKPLIQQSTDYASSYTGMPANDLNNMARNWRLS